MGGARGPPTSWRAVAAAALALWLLPAALALAVLWLPLLCCAVAAVRFLRVRRKLVASGRSRGGCCDGDGDGDGDRDRVPDETATVRAGGRLRLLHRYLDDQVELVVGVGAHDHQEDHEQG
ncbi:uncharacterized protein [Zea mays]|jgi:hypothetical protein|uniref:Uncharacterized protein n=1 Tax=Zea mays TaxID=4577 RepID=K7UCB7_MAIZE|nr:uncharacterized protein LOC103640844 [Zea mays]AQK39579.1 hypothetical protein ZEAMMB73_Zm00001d023568 [Zea mays]|eukprot:XP_008662529.1 uncharacterized protein LOC103640844 [Zea mays]